MQKEKTLATEQALSTEKVLQTAAQSTYNSQSPYRIIISGGGTGGHIYPAIAIANELKAMNPHVQILFVGAQGKMEMQKVPAAGYEIIGLDIIGIQRKFTWKNLLVPIKLYQSFQKAKKIIKDFKADMAIGVGGYASAPLLYAATRMKIPTLIQEQNSYAGLTNKKLANSVNKICVAYPKMEKFFPKEKIIYTGNPVRKDIIQLTDKKEEALLFFNLSPTLKTILIIGGSLGARTINESIAQNIEQLLQNNIQILWQTGKSYVEASQQITLKYPQVKAFEFITEMQLAYAAADIIISRAGALSISELCLVGKPSILIPSPNVAEDHQTKNAMALVDHHAAILVKDEAARSTLYTTLSALLADLNIQNSLAENIKKLAQPKATQHIAQEIFSLLEKKNILNK